MTAERVDADVEAVLAAHEAEWRGDETVSRVRWVCTCKAWRGDDRIDFRAHVAAVLAPLLAARERAAKAEAWDFGYACGLGDCGKRDDETVAVNPYADQPGRDDAGGGGA